MLLQDVRGLYDPAPDSLALFKVPIIFYNGCSGYLIFDIASILPILVGDQHENFPFYAFKLARFVHTNRLFKLFGTILNRFLVARGYNIMKVRDNVDLVTLFVFVFFSTHLLACFWCFLGRLDYHLPKDQKFSWVNFNAFDENDFQSMYVFSIYFILQTLTTVGYGDHTGSTIYEYMFCMIL
jgi:hypothetical protein